ncbi:MAG: sulfite exporter TauE/SafE family protein [Campylobacter sputorum]|uniref:sulfite exporter TauE/SafE family protein n=1 Tax=Campylobacter sputorum TaxID=206 RepID=UPI000B77F98E|nr:sulfite exporter TauE/SafE family protein [Campylobacter sputorum]ASM37886.1 putative membrane protein, sulfite exporter TauE/SafE family [Campylobacter sputorum bv. paraureolyticus LMG 11764]MDY6121009.1 sulfite exporter TauE/SafE family protein [Campylobacter sputorum]
MEIILLIIFGVFAGFCGGFFGIGGGTIVVPLVMSMGYDIKTTVGISILQMLFSSTFGSYVNYKKGKLKVDEGIFVGLGGFVGAGFSGFIVSAVSSKVLEVGLLLALLIAILKFFKSNLNYSPKNPSNFILFIIGFCIGAFAISMGIGGALFLTPILVGFFGVDIKKAVSMGLFFVIFSAVSGFISLAINGHVNYIAGTLLGLGSLVGVYFGTTTSHKIEKSTQKMWLLVLYVSMFLLTLKEVVFG